MKYLFGLQWSEKPTNCALKPRTIRAKAKIISHADDCCVCSLNLSLAQWDRQATTALSNEGKHDQCSPAPKGGNTVQKVPTLIILSNSELGIIFSCYLAGFPKGWDIGIGNEWKQLEVH